MIKRYIDYLKDNPEGYWFKARLFGWGWVPATWQGWLVLVIFMAVFFGNAHRLDIFSLPEDEIPLNFILESIGIVGVFMAVCFRTGEKPRWQWGPPKKKEEKED